MNFSKKLKFAFAFSAFSLSFLMVASPAKNDFKKTFFTLYDGESISTVMAAPINITNNTSVTSTFSVMLMNDVLDGGLTGTTITDNHVGKTWIVQSSSVTNSGSGIDLELTWDASDEVGTPSSYDVVVYNEQQNSWARLNGNLGSVQTSGSTKTLSISGVTEDFTSPLLLAVAPAPAPPAPAITSFSPASGEVGDVVTITGSNFDLTASNNKVYFGSVFAVVNSATTTQLQVVVPKSATHSPITVVSSGGVSKTPTAFRVTNSDISGRSITGSNFGNNIEFSSIGGVTGDLMMAAADFDLDGMVDLVKVGSGNARVHINQLTTSGTITSAAFDAGTNFSVLGSARSVVVDDINGDGKLDIVTGSSSGVSILINTTTGGTLSFATKYDISSGNTAIRVADFDSDGKLDIAAINSSQVNIFLNQSTSNTTSFGSANVVSLSTTGFNGLDVGDMDGDGLYDIVATKSGTTNILVNGSSSGTISFSTPVSLSYGHSYVSVVDLDVDGDNDLFLYHTVVNNNYQSGSLSSTDFSNFTNTYGTDGDNLGLTPADFNGDGYPEVVSGTTWDKMWVYVNSASGNAVSASTISSRWYPRQNLYCGSCGNGLGVDVDGDNKVDAVSSMRTFTKFVITQNEMQPMPSISISGSLSIIEKCQNAASSDQTLTLSGSNLTANVSVPSNSHLEYSIDGGSTWNTSLSIAPSSGSVSETLLVRAKSAVNSDVSATSFSISSTGATSVAVSYEIDVLTPPAVANATISTPSGTAISYTPTVTNGVSNAMYTWTVASANSNVTGEVANSTPSYTFDATLTSTTAVQEQVTYTVTPYTETPGSCPGTPFTLTVTVNPVPTLSSASSLSGYVTEEITLTGTNLSYITSVLVGGQSATFTVNSSTEIVFEVPQNSTGSIVVSDGVSSASLSGFTYLVATTASSVPTASVEGITWHDLMFGSNWDPLDDQQAVAETDLVGDANNVLTQVGSSKMIINGQALDDYYYFRTRMGEADPNTSIYLGLDLDGDNLAEVFVEANNKAQTPYVAYHIADPTKSGVSPSQTGWLNSTNNTNVELQLTGSESQITRYTTGADMENSNQSDDDDWVEWAFSEESLKSFASNALSLNIDGNSAIALFLFTSTSQTANGDIAGIDDNTADLTSSWSDLGIVIYASLNSVSSGEIITPTVTSLSTTNATPTISGYWGGDQGGGDVISIVFNGITYTTSSPELTLNNNAWSITLTSANALVNSGSYDVAVSVTRSGTTVTDETTNEVTFTSDAVAPVVLAQDITLPLDATGNGSITTSDVDNGTTDNSGSFTLSLDITSFTCADLGANTVTLTATDASGNTSSATATVTVVDNIDPTITAPAAVTVNVDAGACSTALTNVTLGTATTADNCSIASTTNDAPTSFPLGATTVTWTVTDGSGNTATATQIVTVEDNIDPVAVAQNITVSLDANGQASITTADVDNGSSDNCTFTLSLDNTSFDCTDLGANTVTLTATDGSGNTHSTTATVTVEDNIDPVAVAQNITVSLDANGQASITTADVDNGSSDNCTYTLSLDNTSFDCSDVGANTVTLTATDGSGNIHSTTATVTVEDNIDPTVNTVASYTAVLDANGEYTVTESDIITSKSDNCTSTPTVSFSNNTFTCSDMGGAGWTSSTSTNASNYSRLAFYDDNGTWYAIGVDQSDKWVILQWNGTDWSLSNTSSMSANSANGIWPIEMVKDANGDFIYFYQYTGGAGYIYAVKFDGSSWSDFITGSTNSSYAIRKQNGGDNDVYVDGSGNVYWSVVSYSTSYNQYPLRVMKWDGTNFTAYPTQTQGYVEVGLADDGNGNPSVTINNSLYTVTSSGWTNEGTVSSWSGTPWYTQLYRASNGDLYAASYQGTVSGYVFDIKLDYLPNGGSWTSLLSSTVQKPTSANYSYFDDMLDFGIVNSNVALLANSGTSSAFEVREYNAGVQVGNTLSSTRIPTNTANRNDFNPTLLGTGSSFSIATTNYDAWNTTVDSYSSAQSVSFTVTDAHGNTTSGTVPVTVVDQSAPTMVVQNITVSLDANGQASITTADVDNGSSDNCSATLSFDAAGALTSINYTTSDLGANNVTLYGTDPSGNQSSQTAVVTVVDQTSPTVITQDVTVYLDANGLATITPSDIDNGTTDNGGTPILSLDITSFDCDDVGANTVTLTATDGSGNTSSATAVVTVVDNTSPTIIAQNITVSLDANGTVSITTADVDKGSSDNCSYTLALDVTSFDCSDVGANTVTLTATDASGNTSSATATVTVVDNTVPTITAPASVTVNVDAGACSTALTNVTLGTPTTADNCSVASTTNDAPTSFPLGATTVTWTVTDGSGNTATASQVVTVVDNLAPVLSCPSNMVVYGAADSTLTSVSWSAATATDNCSLDTVFSDVQIGTFLPLGTTVVTYVAIDGSGNSDTCSFDISVVDTVSPVITSCPSPISQNNDIDSCGAQVVWSSPSYYDNSGYFTVTASHTSGDYFPVGTTTVAITVADTSGNSAVCEFDVVVTDNQIPNVLPYNNVAITLGTDGMYTLAVNDVDSASYDNCGITVKYLSKSFFNCNDVPSATTWLVVEDIHGNKDSALVSLQVSLPATPVLSVLPTINDVLCYGEATGSIQASVSGGVAPYTYNWSNGSTTFDATNLSIGTYWYEVTDTNGCYTTDTLLVNEPAPLTASTVKSIYPGGYNVSINGTSDGSITTTASGGIMPYTFDWNNGAFSTQNLTGIPAGVYALVMTDSNGCVYNLSDTLTEPTRLVATATSLQSVICPDDTTGIVLAAASGAVPPYSYSWDFGSTTDYNTGLTYGIYTVTVTDTNGATATDTVLVDALDYDCDGIYNVDEGGTPNGGGGNGDLDGDGIPNEEDEDSDGDGLLDSEEFDYDNDGVGFDDCDGDGIPNFLDPDLCDLLVPAVFTPNGDGDNDYWEIMGIGAFPDNNVQVFNRWGEMVYFKEGYNNEFNGRANTRTQMNGGDGLLPTGTYYYVVKVYETGDTYTGYVYITK